MFKKTTTYIIGFLFIAQIVNGQASNKFTDLRIIPKATGSRPSGVEGQIYSNSTTHTLQYKDNSAWYSILGADTSQTVTNKTIAVGSNTISGTASRVPQFSAGNALEASAVTSTELGYVGGVTSAIQTQINTKAPAASPTFTGTITTPLTASRAMVTDGSSALAASATTATELGYVSGVTSAIQTQINTISASAAVGSPYQISNVGVKSSISANTLVLELKQADASTDCTAGSPCSIGFRSATVTTGGYQTKVFTAASSLTLAANDSIGVLAAAGQTVFVYAIADTTSELCASGKLFDEGSVVTASALTGGADTGLTTMWCTNAHTSMPIRLLGKITLTWSNPNWASITENSPVPFRSPLIQVLGTESWTDDQANATTSVNLVRVGNRIFVEGIVSFTGAQSGAFNVTIPAQYAALTTAVAREVGPATLWDTGTSLYQGSGHLTSTTNMALRVYQSGSTYVQVSELAATVPHTWANTDKIFFAATWVVAAWDY